MSHTRFSPSENWNQDAEQYRLSILDLQVRLNSAAAAEHASLGELASWVHPGRVTALEVRANS
eukprot:jgi/Botrbrau1/14143/Bobra.182_3s0084.1